MKLNSIVVGFAGVALVLSGLALFNSSKVSTVVEQFVEQYGAAPGPSLNSEYWEVNGLKHWYFRPSVVTSTTTPVSIRTPNATTTLMVGSGCHFTTSSTTNKAISFAKSITTPTATTTFLFGANASANEPKTVIATTTTDGFVFGPRQFLTVSMIGGTGVDSPAGTCSFEFLEIK